MTASIDASLIARMLGIVAALVMFALAALHAYWASGGRFGTDVAIPQRNGQAAFVPGPAATIVVAVLLSAAGLVLLGRLSLWGGFLPRWPFVFGTWLVALTFAARAIGDFRWFGIFKRTTGTSFARWDTLVYMPLCAFLAFAALCVAAIAP